MSKFLLNLRRLGSHQEEQSGLYPDPGSVQFVQGTPGVDRSHASDFLGNIGESLYLDEEAEEGEEAVMLRE